MGAGLRVAVAGASGIGRHHAKWHHAVGSQVVAFVGSSPERCDATSAVLSRLFPFSGRGYTDLAEMLEREQPDVVDVCTPNHLHHAVALAALRAGCHVLCEKPLVWDEPADPAALLAQGRSLLEAAAAGGRHLGVCTQYAASLDQYRRLHQRVRGPVGAVTRLEVEMETVSRGRERDARAIWVDMGSHPLSLLLAWMPEGRIDPATLRAVLAGKEARATFDFVDGEARCRVEMAVRDRPEGAPVRRFGVNGLRADWEGRAGEDGVYRSVLRTAAAEDVDEDFMSRLVRQFAATVSGRASRPLVPGAVGLRNLQLQLDILAAAAAA